MSNFQIIQSLQELRNLAWNVCSSALPESTIQVNAQYMTAFAHAAQQYVCSRWVRACIVTLPFLPEEAYHLGTQGSICQLSECRRSVHTRTRSWKGMASTKDLLRWRRRVATAFCISTHSHSGIETSGIGLSEKWWIASRSWCHGPYRWLACQLWFAFCLEVWNHHVWLNPVSRCSIRLLKAGTQKLTFFKLCSYSIKETCWIFSKLQNTPRKLFEGRPDFGKPQSSSGSRRTFQTLTQGLLELGIASQAPGSRRHQRQTNHNKLASYIILMATNKNWSMRY